MQRLIRFYYFLWNIIQSVGGVRGVMVTIVVDTATRVQIPDEIVCILQNANTLGKGTNPTIPSFASCADWLFKLSMATGLGEGKL